MKAPTKANDVAEIRPEQLQEADGFIFGFPSRFGVMAAQFKAFFDATHELWASQALAGKPAGIFWSTGFPGGGQELTAWVTSAFPLETFVWALSTYTLTKLVKECL
jgi:NAD(P)H dehydrogenase (quinone)